MALQIHLKDRCIFGTIKILLGRTTYEALDDLTLPYGVIVPVFPAVKAYFSALNGRSGESG